MKYLGVDYGKTKIGLAISEGRLAAPLKVLRVQGMVDALNKVMPVIREEDIEIVVVGLAESGEARKITLGFIERLKQLGVEVMVADEHLSTQEAQAKLIIQGGSRKSRQQKEDAVAAAIILQNYLDSLH